MPSFSKLALIFICLSTAIAAPLPQLAGEGAAADSILSDTDNGVGYGIENAEDNTAGLITSLRGGSAAPAPAPAGSKMRRQLAGEGAAANSILSSTDNGVGYGTENAEDNTAALISSLKGGSAAPAPAPAGSRMRRQLDKIANGAQAIGEAAGAGSTTAPATTAGDIIDGDLTSGAANAGADIGSTEEGTLEGAGKAVPKMRRQLDKIANGAQAIGEASGFGTTTEPLTTAGDNIDGDLTSGAANTGADVGTLEESTLEDAGKAVPKL